MVKSGQVRPRLTYTNCQWYLCLDCFHIGGEIWSQPSTCRIKTHKCVSFHVHLFIFIGPFWCFTLCIRWNGPLAPLALFVNREKQNWNDNLTARVPFLALFRIWALMGRMVQKLRLVCAMETSNGRCMKHRPTFVTTPIDKNKKKKNISWHG